MPQRVSQHTSQPSSGGGVIGDVRRLRGSSSEVAAELSEFVAKMKGRSPQEVMGVVAQSGLTQGIVMATFGCLLVTAIFTAGPYFYAQQFPPPAKPIAAQTPPPAATPATNTNTPATATDPANTTPGKDEVLDKLGMGETKVTDPKFNPLENSGDDLLKDLK